MERSLVCLGNWPGWLVLRKPPSCQQSGWWRIKNHLKTSWKDIATTGHTIAGSCLGGRGAKELDWGTGDSVEMKGVAPNWKQGNFGLSLTYQLWNVTGFEVLLPFPLSWSQLFSWFGNALCSWIVEVLGKKASILTANDVCCRCHPGWQDVSGSVCPFHREIWEQGFGNASSLLNIVPGLQPLEKLSLIRDSHY